MKIYLFIFLFNLVLTNMFSQVIKFNYKVEYSSQEINDVKANITITVTEGEPGFTFYLHKGDFRGEIYTQSTTTTRKSYTFENIPEGKYFLKIEDKERRPAGVTINIKRDEAFKQ